MCLSHTAKFDSARSDAFSAKLLEAVNGSAIMLMTSIGHRTGLFDAMEDGIALTSSELAQRAELSERYVREWLGAMATGGIVTFDPATKRYALPKEHAAWLTRSASPQNLSTTAQWIGVLGAVEDQVVEAFHHGRGVPYSAFNRFRDVMAEESSQTTVSALDQHIVPLVPDLQERLERGIRVVDVGCGSGWALIHLAKRFPRSKFVGLDLLDEHISAANDRAASEGLTNLEFKKMDVTHWNEPGAYDLVLTFDAVHDQARPDLVLANIRKALKGDGVYLMQDIKASTPVEKNMENPLAPFIYTISCMHCMSVSLAGGGMGLGAAWGKELAQQMLADAGFKQVEVCELPHDMLNYYYVCKP
ncbi:MAG TPA: class I SAM-dependent methyltransferase [Tepidisphaeraceae bacterium]|nr:class I SAM-dependent methyltransferase [Tepidisphaeraceae bacterium]